jgi:hypothetical protein
MPAITKTNYNTSWKSLFTKYKTLTAKEFSILSGIERKQVEIILDSIVQSQNLTKYSSKNGSIWQLK